MSLFHAMGLVALETDASIDRLFPEKREPGPDKAVGADPRVRNHRLRACFVRREPEGVAL